MADELTDAQVFGPQPAPTIAQSQEVSPVQKELSDADLFASKPSPKDLSWSEVGTEALKSAPSSALEFGKALVQPILHPIDTATALKNLGLGVAQKLGVAAPGEEEKVADALAEHFKERYGGLENIKRTIAKDPVGFLSDASALFTAGGSLAARAPGIVGRIGEITATGARAIDPLGIAARGVGSVGSKLMAIPAETAQAAERLGVQLPAAAASESSLVPRVAGALKEIPIAGHPLAAGSERAIAQLEHAVDTVVHALGSGRAANAGDVVRASTEAWVRGQGGTSGKIQSRLYDAVDNLVSHQYFEPLNNTYQVASNIQARRAQAKISGTSKAVDEVIDAIQSPNGMNYPGVKDLRSYIGNLMDNKDRLVAQNIDAGELKRIYGALTEDMKNIIQGSGGIDAVKAFDKANNVARMVAERRDELRRLLGVSVDASAEQIVQRVADMASGKGAKGNIERLEMLRKSIPQNTWNEMSSAIINRMGRAAEDAPFSGARFVTSYDNLSDRGRQLLFGSTPWLRDAVDDIYTVSQAHKKLMSFGNPSGTGRVATLLGSAAGLMKDPLSTIGSLVGGAVLSQLLATPVGARSVTAWGRAYEAALALPSPGNLQRLAAATRSINATIDASKKTEEPSRRATGGSVLDNMAEARANGGSVNWTANNSLWQQLSPYQKAAAMALMEADRKDPEAAKNALGAMINRAARSNQDLGSHVSQRIYQPTIEATQQARLPSILKSEQFKDLAGWAERRAQGQEPDPVQGATHFLAPERTMLALEAQDPNKYKSWRSWTGFDPEAQAYRNVVLRDKSHAFLAPEGRYSAPYHGEGGEGYRQPTSQDQAALDRLVADASQRGAMDELVQKTTQQPSSISETDKANLAKMIQGLQKQPEMAPLSPIQPVQLGSPTPIAPVTPYDQPRAMGGGVLRKFKKKADGGSISSDGVYGDEDFKWPEQPKPQSGWDRDVVLPLARKVEDGQVVKGSGILGSDWHFATPQMALDALNTALHVGTSKISEPYRLDPEAREKMVEMAGSVIGPQAGVGIGRAAALGAEAGLGSHGGRPPMPKGGSSLDPLGYYSQALEAAKSIPQAKGTPEQMLAQLKKAGAKDAEIAATGLDDYLSGKTVVTKDELIKHLNENRVALNEVRSEANARTGDVQRATALEAQERLNAARDELIGLESGRMSNFMNRRRIETLRNDIIPELRREVQAADEASIATRRTQWENYSLDPNNPTYKETVLHLPESVDKLRDLRQSELNRIVDKYGHLSNAPETERAAFEDLSRRAYEQRPDRIDFQSGHFPEPNIIGHMMTSMTKHEGKPVYTIDQIQSDWGQKIRDRVPMSKEEMAKLQARRETLADALAKLPEERKGTRYEEGLSNQIRLLDAEIKTAEGKAGGHPLVNTTDQWTNTTLRRALTQAVNEGADYIAIPSGDTVLSYNPGDKAGMRGFYGSSEGEGIVPKNLRKLLSKIDPNSAKSVQIDKLETPTRGLQGEGFTLFPITPKVREIIKEKGLPMFEGTIGAQPVNPYDEDRSVLARFKKDRRP